MQYMQYAIYMQYMQYAIYMQYMVVSFMFIGHIISSVRNFLFYYVILLHFFY
jgi:hypothetical protein